MRDPRATIFIILLASVGLAGPDSAFSSSCAEGDDENLTLELRDVAIDGVPAEDATPWDEPTSLEVSHWDSDVLFLAIGDREIGFVRVDP